MFHQTCDFVIVVILQNTYVHAYFYTYLNFGGGMKYGLEGITHDALIAGILKAMSTASVHHNIGVDRVQLVSKTKTNISDGLTYIS